MTRSAETEYAKNHAQAIALMAELQERIENMPAPSEHTDWGHVGDANRLIQDLSAILEYA